MARGAHRTGTLARVAEKSKRARDNVLVHVTWVV